MGRGEEPPSLFCSRCAVLQDTFSVRQKLSLGRTTETVPVITAYPTPALTARCACACRSFTRTDEGRAHLQRVRSAALPGLYFTENSEARAERARTPPQGCGQPILFTVWLSAAWFCEYHAGDGRAAPGAAGFGPTPSRFVCRGVPQVWAAASRWVGGGRAPKGVPGERAACAD